jgi:peptidoglycan/LPS O-acetylase OafA/YrhL
MSHAQQQPLPAGRLPGLDGLRGLAASVVVVHHCLLTSGTLAGAYRPSPPSLPWWANLLSFTPIHLIWAGREAVFVFFVLSGFVLTYAVLAGERRWLAYYPRRLVRLYLPVFGAVALAVAWTALVPRHHLTGVSWWLNAHHGAVNGSQIQTDALLLTSHQPGRLASPLWSLKWEVIFSLLLPLFVVGATAWRRAWPLKLGILLGLLMLSPTSSHQSMLYLPMFGVGALMAVHAPGLLRLGARLGRVGGALLLVAGLLLVQSYWLPQGWISHDQTGLGLIQVIDIIGAAILVLLFLAWSPAATFGASRSVGWLGKRSFSMYLVHEPLVVSLAILLPWAGGLPVLLLAVVPVLVITGLFFRYVERPSHHIARAIGRRRPPRSGDGGTSDAVQPSEAYATS